MCTQSADALGPSPAQHLVQLQPWLSADASATPGFPEFSPSAELATDFLAVSKPILLHQCQMLMQEHHAAAIVFAEGVTRSILAPEPRQPQQQHLGMCFAILQDYAG